MSPDDSPFTSTAAYYADYRPDYPDEALAHVADLFDLTADTRVLDLGCGPGKLTIPLAEYAGHVVGVDPDEVRVTRGQVPKTDR